MNRFEININAQNQYDYILYQTSLTYKRINNISTNCYYSLIKNIRIKNVSNENYEDLVVSFISSSDIISFDNVNIDFLNQNQEIHINNIEPHIDVSRLYNLNESIEVSLQILIHRRDEIIDSSKFIFQLSPFINSSLIYEDPNLFACYVTPNDYLVNKITLEATKELELINGERTFLGYQSGDINQIRAEMMAIFNALYKHGISYSNPPASFEKFQKVRIAQEVLYLHKGTCLDLSILYCACLENIGLHPILVVVPGHSYAGVFLDEEGRFIDNILTSSAQLYNIASLGNNKCTLVECTLFTNEKYADFNKSIEIALDRTLNSKKEFYAIDIFSAHCSYFKPIPTLNENQEIDFKIELSGASNNLELLDTENNGKIITEISKKANKFDYWEKKLLDLTLTNRLINLKFNSSVIQISTYSSNDLFNFLLNHEKANLFIRELKNKDKNILYYSFKNEEFKAIINQNYSQGLLEVYTNEKDLKKIIKKASDSLEETGSNTLYLTLGLIRFHQPKSKKMFFAPIILVPITAKSRKINGTYEVEFNIDDAFINSTVLEYFKINYEANFDELYGALDDIENVNINTIFNTLRSKSSNSLDILIEDNACFISNFSFSNYILWDDIKNRKEELMRNEVVKSLVEGANLITPKEESNENIGEIDDVAVALSADSSQIKAVADAEKGETFVLDGPPGTGKSQTIVNMIVNALYHNKSVLFVAEKKAALDVVYKRIKDIGLSKFALELHSNKASKASVLSQLKEALEFEQSESPQQFEVEANKLYNQRKELNSIIDKLHNSKNHFMSLYDAIILYEENRDFANILKFKDGKALNVNQEIDEEIKHNLHVLNIYYNQYGSITNNVFRIFDFNSFQDHSRKEVVQDIEDLYKEAVKTNDAFNDLKDALGLPIYYNYENLSNIYKVLKIISEKEVKFNLTLSDIIYSEKDKVSEAFKECESLLHDFKTIILKLKNYGKNISFDIEKFNALNDKEKRKYVKSFKRIIKENSVDKKAYKELKSNLENVLISLDNYSKKSLVLEKTLQNSLKILEIDYNSFMNEYEKYVSIYNDSLEVISFLKCFDETKEVKIEVYNKLKEFYENKDEKISYYFVNFDYIYSNVLSKENSLNLKYGFDKKYINSNGRSFLEDYKTLIGEGLANGYEMDEILMANRAVAAIEKLDLFANFKDLYKQGKLDENNLEKYYLGSLASEIINDYFDDEEITLFNGLLFNDKIDKYKNLVEEISKLTILETASRISSKFPSQSTEYAPSTNVYKLNRLIKNGGHRTSIRKMMNELEDLIRTLCPCFLMSPQSAAQYLSINSKKFDIVIFDEASQIPTYEAVGAIARGNSLVIAGDPEQLPPTNFFKANNSDEDDDATEEIYEDLESLLDDCLALNIKRNQLLWHYRSHHESLIAFSNNNFYKNQLYTFPSPFENHSKVSLRYLEYGSNSKGVNKEEAREIVKEVKRRFSDKNLCHKTIGIVTFNIHQQDYIRDLISDMFDENPSFAQINEENSDQLFVKNLESVQGDERDVILFSVGFSKNSSGNLSLMFGPLSRSKGERRLNVAVTRSKEEMIVFSSIRARDINPEKAKNNGAEILRRFLDYAERGSEALSLTPQNIVKHNLGVEKYIKRDLYERGYDSDLAVGESRFKVDLAVKNSDGDYILGIMCDSESYYKTPTCRDRNVVQIGMMNRLNWKIYRVWTLDYYRYPDRVIDEIIDIIKNIDAYEFKNDSLNVSKKDIVFKKKKQISVDNSRPYIKFEAPKTYLTYNVDYKDHLYSWPQLTSFIDGVIKVEGPISLDLLKERFKEYICVTKWGVNVEKLFKANLNKGKYQTSNSFNKEFYWPLDNSEMKINYYRKSNYLDRPLSDVPLEEYQVAIEEILTVQSDVSLDDAIKLLAKKFGYQNVSETTHYTLSNVYQAIIEKYPRKYTKYLNEHDNLIHIKTSY